MYIHIYIYSQPSESSGHRACNHFFVFPATPVCSLFSTTDLKSFVFTLSYYCFLGCVSLKALHLHPWISSPPRAALELVRTLCPPKKLWIECHHIGVFACRFMLQCCSFMLVACLWCLPECRLPPNSSSSPVIRPQLPSPWMSLVIRYSLWFSPVMISTRMSSPRDTFQLCANLCWTCCIWYIPVVLLKLNHTVP